MIEFLSAYIKTIVSLLLLSVFAEILMPEGGYKKYLKLLTGLVITLTVLKPVTYIFGLSEERLFGIVERETEEIWGGALDFDVSSDNETLEMGFYKEQVASMINEDAAKKGVEAEKTEVTVDEDINSDSYGRILDVKIYVPSGKSENDKKTADYISGKYRIMSKNIDFIYQ